MCSSPLLVGGLPFFKRRFIITGEKSGLGLLIMLDGLPDRQGVPSPRSLDAGLLAIAYRAIGEEPVIAYGITERKQNGRNDVSPAESKVSLGAKNDSQFQLLISCKRAIGYEIKFAEARKTICLHVTRYR